MYLVFGTFWMVLSLSSISLSPSPLSVALSSKRGHPVLFVLVPTKRNARLDNFASTNPLVAHRMYGCSPSTCLPISPTHARSFLAA